MQETYFTYARQTDITLNRVAAPQPDPAIHSPDNLKYLLIQSDHSTNTGIMDNLTALQMYS